MESFLSFIIEAAKKERDFNLNDAKGKLYEILAGSHLAHGTHSSGAPNNYLQHYRDEEGKTPQDVHDFIKGELEKRSPGMYETINDHARHGAEHMRAQLHKDGHHEIRNVAWTSQAGDHKRFTGVDDPNSDADIMVHSNRGHVGISAKYGTSKNMNLRNNGLEKLEALSNSPAGSIVQHREEHSKNLKSLGISNHQDYKNKRDSDDPLHQEAVAKAEDSAYQAQKNMSKQMSDSLSKMKPEQLKDYISNVISPQNHFTHYRMHTRPASDENFSAVSHHMEDTQKGRDLLNSFSDLRAKPHGNGITFQIEGKRHGSEKYEPVLDQAIKKGSGPTKGFASTTKAPFLTKAPTKAPVINAQASTQPKPKPVKQIVQSPAPVAPPSSIVTPAATPTPSTIVKPKAKKTVKSILKNPPVSTSPAVQKLAATRQKAKLDRENSVGGYSF